MKPIIFKGKNNTTIKLSFKLLTNDLHQPVLKSSKGDLTTIPLLLDITQIKSTYKKLADLKNESKYDLILLKNIVAGACSMSMKKR